MKGRGQQVISPTNSFPNQKSSPELYIGLLGYVVVEILPEEVEEKSALHSYIREFLLQLGHDVSGSIVITLHHIEADDVGVKAALCSAALSALGDSETVCESSKDGALIAAARLESKQALLFRPYDGQCEILSLNAIGMVTWALHFSDDKHSEAEVPSVDSHLVEELASDLRHGVKWASVSYHLSEYNRLFEKASNRAALVDEMISHNFGIYSASPVFHDGAIAQLILAENSASVAEYVKFCDRHYGCGLRTYFLRF